MVLAVRSFSVPSSAQLSACRSWWLFGWLFQRSRDRVDELVGESDAAKIIKLMQPKAAKKTGLAAVAGLFGRSKLAAAAGAAAQRAPAAHRRRRDRRVLQFRNADRISNQYLRLRSGRISVFGFYQGGPASEYNLFDYIRFLDTFDLGILKTGIE